MLQRPHLAVESTTHGRGAVTEGLDILIFLSMYSDESFFLDLCEAFPDQAPRWVPRVVLLSSFSVVGTR